MTETLSWAELDEKSRSARQLQGYGSNVQVSPQAEQSTGTIIATPFKWRDPATIPRREFCMDEI